MKKVIVVMMMLLAMGAVAGAAHAGSWIPGTPWMVEDSEVSDLLETQYDWAYCRGIPRFGHTGEFPYERHLVFDCSTELDDTYCSDRRYKTVKSKRRGYFALRLLRPGSCF
jgi:hypothetical protein